MDMKLEVILLEYGNRVLRVANNEENPTIGEMLEVPREKIKQLFKEQSEEK